MKLQIPFRPISKKNNRRNFASTSLPSRAYMKFEDNAINYLLNKQIIYIDGVDEKRRPIYKSHLLIGGYLKIDYLFYMKGALDTDCDNMIAGVNDLLQLGGIIENDKLIIKGSYEKVLNADDWMIEVDITPTVPVVLAGKTKVLTKHSSLSQ